MPRTLRDDADHFRTLLTQRGFFDLWHFTPLHHLPCILFHGGLFSIQEMDRRGLRFQARASHEDDIQQGVGDSVKLSWRPYWHMLSKLMRDGMPHALIRFNTQPVLFAGTSFGDRNVWESGWRMEDSYEFARDYVFVRQEDWAGTSPPEIYVQRDLQLVPYARTICICMKDELDMLEACLARLHIESPVRLYSAGGVKYPFPDACRDEYLASRDSQLERVRDYFQKVTDKSLSRGVEIDCD